MGEKTGIDTLRLIPSVDRLFSDPLLSSLKEKYSENLLKNMIRRSVNELRQDVLSGRADQEDCSITRLVCRTEDMCRTRIGPRLREVINATGVIVHTNLGRSPLSLRVAERVHQAALSYSNLEYDLEKGRRGERNSHLRTLMEELTGAEAALAVNNNAAAVLLALSSLANGREVIVSRGELIEIGGSFRIPNVMARSGAVLREVGTTNRTHPRDYAEAINERTALILKVHTSNYRIVGFTREVDLDELVSLGRERGIPTMMDLGSGCLVDLSDYGLEGEPTVSDVISTGIDVVSFSGDKLLGGPQAGILAGRRELIERMRTDPLARALRMDKLTLAALEGALLEYTRPEGPFPGIPTLGMIASPPDELDQRARLLAEMIRHQTADQLTVSVDHGAGKVGGGALPLGDLPGPRIVVRPKHVSAARLEKAMRAGDPPIISMVREDAVLFDPRTILAKQLDRIPQLVSNALKKC